MTAAGEFRRSHLIRIFRLASVGRQANGLIHNLNGPLQNLSLDVEMIRHHISRASGIDADLMTGTLTRLKRMEEEIDRAGSLIKVFGSKAFHPDGPISYANLNDFFYQELWFQQTNLYFKHNVRTEMDLHHPPPPVSGLPDDFLTAISWLMQAIVEELERQDIKGLGIKTLLRDSSLGITIATEDGNLSGRFMGLLSQGLSWDQHLGEGDGDMLGVLLSLALLEESGAAVEGRSLALGSSVSIHLPLHRG